MSTVTFIMALLMGLTGSLHCAGMCGPIIWVMPFQSLQDGKKWLGIGLYHLGRISTYAVLALVLHSFRALFHPQWQQYVSIVLGLLLFFAGILSFFPAKSLHYPWTVFVQKQLSRFMGKPAVGALFITGLLNGLLPCGLVYMALSASMAAGTAVHAMLLMYVFGLGTMPMLIALTMLKNRMPLFRLQTIKKFVPVVMLVFGFLFMLRGMNLGIPYLSPRLEATQHEIKADCCHKK